MRKRKSNPPDNKDAANLSTCCGAARFRQFISIQKKTGEQLAFGCAAFCAKCQRATGGIYIPDEHKRSGLFFGVANCPRPDGWHDGVWAHMKKSNGELGRIVCVRTPTGELAPLGYKP